MIAILDYGVGNLFSLHSSLSHLGIDSVVTADPRVIGEADRIILPGVGAFGDAIAKLKKTGLDIVIRRAAEAGKPILGICLGMQLLFERSYEYGESEGLALLPGAVMPLRGAVPAEYRIPHIGWNRLTVRRDCPILRYTKDGDYVYFVHSFYVDGEADCCAASTDYGTGIAAAVARANVYGCQFHPEKSGEVGLSILRAFNETEGGL